MARQLSILCVHGIGHGDADEAMPKWWTEAITTDIHRWDADLQVEVDFLRYDDLFDHAPLDMAVYGEALARLMASGILHGIGDFFADTRGLGDVPDLIRWTAGM